METLSRVRSKCTPNDYSGIEWIKIYLIGSCHPIFKNRTKVIYQDMLSCLHKFLQLHMYQKIGFLAKRPTFGFSSLQRQSYFLFVRVPREAVFVYLIGIIRMQCSKSEKFKFCIAWKWKKMYRFISFEVWKS